VLGIRWLSGEAVAPAREPRAPLGLAAAAVDRLFADEARTNTMRTLEIVVEETVEGDDLEFLSRRHERESALRRGRVRVW
jgi:hypothetical protein